MAILGESKKLCCANEPNTKGPDAKTHDSVHAFACEVLTLGLLLMEFNDAIREGGKRIIKCWRYFLLLFSQWSLSSISIYGHIVFTQRG